MVNSINNKYLLCTPYVSSWKWIIMNQTISVLEKVLYSRDER